MLKVVDLDHQAISSSFVQSPWWADFQRSLGKDIHELKGDGWLAYCTVQKVPKGTYWLLPYGPIVRNKAGMTEALTTIKAEAKAAGALWVRFEPRLQENFTPSAAMRRAPHLYNPEHTIINDLRLDLIELKKHFSNTNRNLANKTDRGDFYTFWTSTNPEDMEHFITLQEEVSKRTGAIFHEADYMRKQAALLMPQGVMRLELGGMKADKPLATAIIHDYNGVATYTYAAAAYEARKTAVGNALVWQAMKNAKARGCHSFDLFGIAAPNAARDDPWLGFTFFKKAYGGQEVAFAGTWDMPLSSLYHVFAAHTKLRRSVRRLKQVRKHT